VNNPFSNLTEEEMAMFVLWCEKYFFLGPTKQEDGSTIVCTHHYDEETKDVYLQPLNIWKWQQGDWFWCDGKPWVIHNVDGEKLYARSSKGETAFFNFLTTDRLIPLPLSSYWLTNKPMQLSTLYAKNGEVEAIFERIVPPAKIGKRYCVIHQNPHYACAMAVRDGIEKRPRKCKECGDVCNYHTEPLCVGCMNKRAPW
jgi:hypothetical protein